ncbi:MAG: MmcQ/YjbR family DNA-binding protein [Terrabacter sp.]|nr:MmcQ/YjbR family DNA-binding protein [Terrabacter sp.]
MATWADVDEVAGRLPGAVLGVAHEGSPAWHAGRHTFARLRWDDDGRELVQVWTGEMDTEQALADRRDTFVRIDTFRYRVTMWARLDRLGRTELAELLVESYDIRGGRRRCGDTDVADLLGNTP